MAAELEAADDRHNDVADDNVRVERDGELESFRAIESGRDLVTFDLEQLNQQIEDLPIVIDDQDAARV